MEKGRPPGRLRHSWEARCRLVSLVLSGLAPQAASMACGMSRATAYRLLRRYQEDGWEGLRDRPPIAKHHPHRLSAEAEAQIVALRRQTGWGPRSLVGGAGPAGLDDLAGARRHDCSRAERQPRPAANRYEYAAVGELVHLDIKKLGRFWQVGKRILNDGVQPQRRRRLELRPRRRRRPLPLRPPSSCRPSEQASDCAAFAAARDRGLRRAGHPDPAHPHRQRRWLSQPRLPRPARPARHPPHPHPALHAQDKRQSRSLHPHPATRMGLRLRLPNKQPPRQSTPRLAALVQQPPTTRRHRRPPTHHPRLTRCEVLQLAVGQQPVDQIRQLVQRGDLAVRVNARRRRPPRAVQPHRPASRRPAHPPRRCRSRRPRAPSARRRRRPARPRGETAPQPGFISPTCSACTTNANRAASASCSNGKLPFVIAPTTWPRVEQLVHHRLHVVVHARPRRRAPASSSSPIHSASCGSSPTELSAPAQNDSRRSSSSVPCMRLPDQLAGARAGRPR